MVNGITNGTMGIMGGGGSSVLTGTSMTSRFIRIPTASIHRTKILAGGTGVRPTRSTIRT